MLQPRPTEPNDVSGLELLESLSNPATSLSVESQRVGIAADQLTEASEFIRRRRVGIDPDDPQGGVLDETQSQFHELSCGCLVRSPNDLSKICPVCAQDWYVRATKEKRYLCSECTECMFCRRRSWVAGVASTVCFYSVSAILWLIGIDVERG